MKSSRMVVVCLLAMSFALVAIRSLTYNEPPERDLTTYAVIAHEMLGGRALYSDMWDIKPPGVYLSYAAAEVLVGYGINQFLLLGVVVALITLFGIYRLTVEMTDDKIAGLCAALFWTVTCSDIDLLANQPNTEAFINAACVWGLVFYVQASKTRFGNLRLLLVAGCIWAVGTFFKQVGGVLPLLLGIYFLFQSREMKPKSKMLGVLALWCPTAVLWGLSALYFAATGRWDILVFTLIKFGRIYAAEGTQMASTASPWTLLAPKELLVLAPILILAWLCLLITRRQLSPKWVLIGVVAVATQIAISLPGHYHMHYYQLWLPIICWVGGFAVAQLRAARVRYAVLTPWVTGGVALGLLVIQWPKWCLSPTEVSIRKYDSPIFVDMTTTSSQLDSLLKPNETLYQYGFDSGFYFVTKRRPPVGVICLGMPNVVLPDWFQESIVDELQREKPSLALVDTLFPKSQITDYLVRNYVALPRKKEGKEGQFILLVRRRSDLERRIHKLSSLNWP